MKRKGGAGLGRNRSWSVMQATEGPDNPAGSPGVSAAHLQWEPTYLQTLPPSVPRCGLHWKGHGLW